MTEAGAVQTATGVELTEGLHSHVRVLTSGDSHFFGFHDLTPWDAQSERLVCLRTKTTEDHVPVAGDSADVVIIDERNGDSTFVASTTAWNWQQGSRERFLPSLGRSVVTFNVATESGFAAQIVDLEKRTSRLLSGPLFDVFEPGGWGLGLNFTRLWTCSPGYGYDHLNRQPLPALDADGIWRVDISSGAQHLLLSIASFLREHRIASDMGAHYFTHINISPDGDRFCFLHRCNLPNGSVVTNLVVADKSGTKTRIVADDKVSHFDWKNPETIFVWCRKNSAVRKLKESKLRHVAALAYRISRRIRTKAVRQFVYRESFRDIDVRTGDSVDVAKGILTEDGHPQRHPMLMDIWVNDTYPDPAGLQTLMLYDQAANKRLDILRLQTHPSVRHTPWRCDFHPRWSPDGARICFDSTHQGRRQICVVSAPLPGIANAR